MLQKSINSFIYAMQGLKTTWREERNFRIEVCVSVIVAVSLVYFKFSLVESVLCVLAVTLVLSAEIINTALEDLCNKVEPEHDPVIGKIKDTAAAFVFVTVLGSIVVGVLVFCSHFN
jgi:diacylglycerol kinase